MKRVELTRSAAATLLAVAAFLFINIVPAYAAPADVYLKKDGYPISFWAWMGGVSGSGSPLYMYVEYVPTTVMKEHKDGALWIHDSANTATISIGTGEWGTLPSVVLYQGTGSIVLQGLWTYDPDTGWFWPSEERMNWHIMATVLDSEGNEWTLYWQLVRRNGKVNETYRFEPAN
jgi:hypothetical protein